MSEQLTVTAAAGTITLEGIGDRTLTGFRSDPGVHLDVPGLTLSNFFAGLALNGPGEIRDNTIVHNREEHTDLVCLPAVPYGFMGPEIDGASRSTPRSVKSGVSEGE